MKTTTRADALLLLFSFLAAAASSSGEEAAERRRCHPDDQAALLAIKAALNNPRTLEHWTPGSSCCDWYEVDCHVLSGRVVGLSIHGDDTAAGAIPGAVADLAGLTSLTIAYAAGVSGPVPPFLARLTRLRELDLSHNNLSGGIPPEWAALRLRRVDLSENAIAGDAARRGEAIDLPPRLNFLDLSHNAIYGGIPAAQVANLSHDREVLFFDVSDNQLCGEVPESLAGFDVAMFQHNKCLCGAPLLPCLGRSTH
ncbi:hypothetical protein ACP4OV_018825 [Aristida adscensionis]